MVANTLLKPSIAMRVRAWLELMNRPASARFLWTVLAITWFGTLVLWRADFRNFLFVCDHDPGAALHTDEVISAGARPGTDFYYPYGLLSLFIPHLFFAVFGRSPAALVSLIGLFSLCSYIGIAWSLGQFKPSRLGATLLAAAAGHATWQVTPMYAMETAMLIWAVALRLRDRRVLAIVVATVVLFVKMSMASVVVAELLALTVVDAVRSRRAQALTPLLAAPVTAALCSVFMIAWLDKRALIGSFDASVGARMYRAYNFGFFREGRLLWDPTGHTIFWYLGGIPGPWLLASGALVVLAIAGSVRLLRSCITRTERDLRLVSAEAATMSGFANLAYIMGFYGPALNGTFYYAWFLLVGVAPSIAGARLHFGERLRRRNLAINGSWLSLGLLLLSSQSVAVRQFFGFIAEPRVKVGSVTITPEHGDELAVTLALGHSTGAGVITAVARASNFGLVDPTIRQGHHWQLLKGVPQMKAIEEMLHLARVSDTLLVPAYDYWDLLQIPQLRPLLEHAQRLHAGKRLLLLRAQPGESEEAPNHATRSLDEPIRGE